MKQAKNVQAEAEQLGVCDRGDCTRKPTHYVLGYAWGVPLVCTAHAREERTIKRLTVKPLTAIE